MKFNILIEAFKTEQVYCLNCFRKYVALQDGDKISHCPLCNNKATSVPVSAVRVFMHNKPRPRGETIVTTRSDIRQVAEAYKPPVLINKL